VAAILGAHCAGCHGEELAFGGQFALTRREHFHAPALSDGERELRELATESAQLLDSKRRMPPSSLPALGEVELATLTAWLEGGAQPSGEGCQVEVRERAKSDAGLSLGGSGGARKESIDYRDPELECHKFTTHAPGKKDEPYSVPTTPDIYIDFAVDAP